MEYISASDLERYGYCPLSWWLSRENTVTSPALEKGEKRHDEMAEDLAQIKEEEETALVWERSVIMFSIVATALALVGVSLMPVDNAEGWGAILGALSIPWVISAIFMLLQLSKVKEEIERARYENMIIFFAIVATLIALNSMTILSTSQEVAIFLEVIALGLLIIASISAFSSISGFRKAEQEKEERDIEGTIRYVDDNDSRLMKSDKYGITGRPDFIIENDDQRVPVEVKTGRTPKGPFFSHILQVAAYCLLLSEETGKEVSHGVLRYGDVEHEIEFNEELKGLLLSKVEEMRELLETEEVHRNHNREGKCISCSRREICPERLA